MGEHRMTAQTEAKAEREIHNPVLTPEQAAEIRKRHGMKRRTFQFHMKLVESDSGRREIEGYASTRDLDRTGEVVEPGAFAESLTEFMGNPVLTYMHDWSNPIGKVTEARIDEVGLFIRAEISETAEKVWKLIREGILRAFSIGYEVVEEKVIEGINHILRLRLYEVAVVSIPANRRALFSVTKALEAGNDLVVGDGDSPESITRSRGTSHAKRMVSDWTVAAAEGSGTPAVISEAVTPTSTLGQSRIYESRKQDSVIPGTVPAGDDAVPPVSADVLSEAKEVLEDVLELLKG